MRESVLANGVRVLTESIPSVRSVAAGVWVRHGSAHETPDLSGASHLLEHLVFKGTEQRGPKEIALALERLGGSLDAATSREYTSFQVKVLSEHLPIAVDVLADLVLHPLLRQEDLDLEREVVLEEISAMEDTPDDLIFELHGGALWGDHPYGRSILGTRDSVRGMSVETLRELQARAYLSGDLIIGAAGFLEHDAFTEEVSQYFSGTERQPGSEVPGAALETQTQDIRVHRDGVQTHLVFGTRTPPRSDPSRFPLILLSTAFGGGMGSRLFQKVREELGLGYAVYAYQAFYSKAGVAGVYVGTRPEWGARAVEAIRDEYQKLYNQGLTETELDEVKNQVKGQVMLSLESTSSRLFRLAGCALYDEPVLTLDQLLGTIDAVTLGDVAEVAHRFFDPESQTLLSLGPDPD
jgi:predicted Zn-dependent peptidase